MTKKSNQLLALDVGHGNSYVLISGDRVAVADSPRGPILVDTLAQLGIKKIDAVFVSHADADHIEGITTLLLNEDFKITAIYANPDASKQTKAWQNFCVAAADAAKRGTLVTHVNSSMPALKVGELTIEILAPLPADALIGTGGKDAKGKTIDSNSASIVLKVLHNKTAQVLLTGDMDAQTLSKLLDNKTDLAAKILIYPHHGGLPGKEKNPKAFANQLCEAVKPIVVIFSNERSHKFDNPREEILDGVFQVKPRVACTQISKTCISDTEGLEFKHLADVPAKGRSTKSSCAGSICFDISNVTLDSLLGHQEFVLKNVTKALCRRFS